MNLNHFHSRRLLLAAAFFLTLQPSQGWAGPDAEEDTAATQIGIRFTPEMAAAMARKFSADMKPRYDLSDRQVEEIAPIIEEHLWKFANKNAVLGRDMIETMIAGTIENEGRFDQEGALRFAKLATRFMPKFKEMMTQSSAEIAMKMNVTQRLKYTADVGVFAAGLMVFENRMKQWENGDIPENPSPFFDRPRREPPKVDPEPEDPRETAEHRKARREVERWIAWQMNPDDQWQDYLERSAKYYGYTETQLTSANSILKECRERATAIKTPEWKSAVKENRVIRQLSYGAGDEISNGPWMQSVENAYEKLIKPLSALDAEFKRRLDDLPDSTQRAKAREGVRKILAPKGVTQLPN